LLLGCRGAAAAAVALEVLGAAEESDRHAGDDVRGQGQGDEQGLRERGLVDLAGEEEV
jgi:hypothetical protein